MCYGWPEAAREKRARYGVERQGVLLEERNVEYCFEVGKVQACEIGIYSGVWGPIIRDTSRRADAGSGLVMEGRVIDIV